MTQRGFAVALSLGPVGAFIAGGRRSRDLWFGSRFLSEATRLVADALSRSKDVKLWVPTPDPDRIARSFLVRGRGDSYRGPTISNRIICRVTLEEPALREFLEQAVGKAHAFLAQEIRKHLERIRDVADTGTVERQARAIEGGDFVETYAAWARIAPEGDLADAEENAIRRANQLVDGRKAARLFCVPVSEPGKPKCSLDPGWDSVLVEPDGEAPKEQRVDLLLGRQRLGIRLDERLSAIALARRLASFAFTLDGAVELPPLPFPPLAQVAADAWLHAAWARPGLQGEVERVHLACRSLRARARDRFEHEAFFVLTTPSRRPGSRGVADVAFDASIYFENALETRRRELYRFRDKAQVAWGRLAAHVAFLDELREPVARLQRALGVPVPYFVMLEADGDGVGEALLRARGDARGVLVQALYRFADRAHDVVDEHHGCAFYVGGDELAAYLPLDTGVRAALALARLYDSEVRPHAPETSLSVGLVVAHVQDDLRATRARATAALREAKARRRRGAEAAASCRPGYLVVRDEPRAGEGRCAGGPIEDVAARLSRCIDLLHEEQVSVGTAHAIRDLAVRIDASEGSVGLALGRSILGQKQRRSERGTAGDDRAAMLIEGADTWGTLLDRANLLLLGARIAPVAALRRAPLRGAP